MLVDVALPLPLKQNFTYKVPEHLKIFRGSILLVPFGNKKIVGVAVDFPKTTNVASNKLKYIYDTLFSALPISEELIELAKWISKYYCSSFGESLSLILPPGINKISKRKYSFCDDKDPLSFKLNENDKIVLEIIKKNNSLTVNQIENKSGLKSINHILDKLIGLDLIKSDEAIATSRTKFEKWIELDKSLQNVNPKTSAQKRILEYFNLQKLNSVSVKTLLTETKTSSNTLNLMVKKGFFKILKKEINREVFFKPVDEIPKNIKLTDEQNSAFAEISNAIESNQCKNFLLHGVTGSGKTEVYIEAIKKVISLGGSAIYLVPEISLTPQTVRRLSNYFKNEIAILHSRLSDGERFDAWNGIRNGKYKIVIGARSAVFVPLENIKLIIVDEEHESSYKQFDSSPNYNARDVAILRAQKANAVVVLGSATPSVESYFNATTGKYTLLKLTKRIDEAKLPEVKIIDLREEQKEQFLILKEKAKVHGKKIFDEATFSISKELNILIQDKLNKKEGIIILQNRRGYAPFLICIDCGFTERCNNCDITLTYHLTKKHLRCHICGITKIVPDVCPKCQSYKIKLSGFGTQRVEEQIQKKFPNAKIIRFDLDTTSTKGAHDDLLQKFSNREADILLGTQMIAKGLDFAHVSLVGVISADTQMLLPDFRSSERTFQLITQVAGRAGRGKISGEVLVQTYQPKNVTLQFAKNHDYDEFFKNEIENRKDSLYPPFVRLVLIEFKGANEVNVSNESEKFYNKLNNNYSIGRLLGPTPAVISKIKNQYRYHIIAKALIEKDPGGSKLREVLSRLQNEFKSSNVNLSIDVDPYSLM